MERLRFYLEYPSQHARVTSKRTDLGDHSDTVVAVVLGTAKTVKTGIRWDCYAMGKNGVEKTHIMESYLRTRCARISQSMAREVHPQLFAYLDNHGD